VKIVAILCVRNGELYLRRCLEHVQAQGVSACVVDNGSTDGSLAVAEEWKAEGAVERIERLPYHGAFNVRQVMRFKERLASEIDADWFIHWDVDEIKEAPAPHRTLAEGILEVDRRGYNAINFDEFVFVPVSEDERYEGRDYVAEMKHYYYFEPRPWHRINAWKRQPSPVDLHSWNGHRVEFPGRSVCPEPFVLRHYIALSKAHALAKYAGRVHDAERIERTSWDDPRISFAPAKLRLVPKERLKEYRGDRVWDKSDPWSSHPLLGEEQWKSKQRVLHRSEPGPEPRLASVRSALGRVLPSLVAPLRGAPAPMPFVVGAPRSGTTLLRLMLDAHPELAIPPETHFVAEALDLRGKDRELRARFCRLVTHSPRWGDFHLDAGALERRLQGIRPFRLEDGLRVFYRMYADRLGKRRVGDKTPGYVLHLRRIAAVLPEARFVHLIRDGRDVAASLRKLWWGPGDDVEAQAVDWLWRIREARQQAQVCPGYLEVRYEDLVREPEAQLRRVCEFLGLTFERRMLEFYGTAAERLDEQNARSGRDGGVPVTKEQLRAIHARTQEPPNEAAIGRFERDLSPREVDAFQRIAGALLAELGYELV
jgi:glycosyltransferase involved in cell wall biosynthesis